MRRVRSSRSRQMDLNFCVSTAIELMDTYHITSLPYLLPLFIITALALSATPARWSQSGRGLHALQNPRTHVALASTLASWSACSPLPLFLSAVMDRSFGEHECMKDSLSA